MAVVISFRERSGSLCGGCFSGGMMIGSVGFMDVSLSWRVTC
jgi:hypothetical protein